MKTNTGKYVDGFVLVIPKDKVAAYTKMAREGAKVWKKFGALDYKECIGEDLNPSTMGGEKMAGFTKLAKAGEGDTVWFSYITYKSKKDRDAVNKKVMAHFAQKYAKAKNPPAMPFDMKRMAYGGFKVVVSG